MSEIDAWGRAETIQKSRPRTVRPLTRPSGRGSPGENVVVNGFDFWWDREEWLPSVDTLRKIQGSSKKSWPESG